jgi:hypothetical protein
MDASGNVSPGLRYAREFAPCKTDCNSSRNEVLFMIKIYPNGLPAMLFSLIRGRAWPFSTVLDRNGDFGLQTNFRNVHFKNGEAERIVPVGR